MDDFQEFYTNDCYRCEQSITWCDCDNNEDQALVTSYQVALVCSLIFSDFFFQIVYRTYLQNIQILYKSKNKKLFRFVPVAMFAI